MVCTADEMAWRLEQFSSARVNAGEVPNIVQGPVLVSKELWKSPGPGLLQAQHPIAEQPPESFEAPERVLINPEIKDIRPLQNWFERWLFPDAPNREK